MVLKWLADINSLALPIAKCSSSFTVRVLATPLFGKNAWLLGTLKLKEEGSFPEDCFLFCPWPLQYVWWTCRTVLQAVNFILLSPIAICKVVKTYFREGSKLYQLEALVCFTIYLYCHLRITWEDSGCSRMDSTKFWIEGKAALLFRSFSFKKSLSLCVKLWFL